MAKGKARLETITFPDREWRRIVKGMRRDRDNINLVLNEIEPQLIEKGIIKPERKAVRR